MGFLTGHLGEAPVNAAPIAHANEARRRLAHRGADTATWALLPRGRGHALLLSGATRSGPNVVLAFDGRLTNGAELLRELRGQGEPPRGQTDADAVALAWAVWGAEALPRLEGSFALAALDLRIGEVALARDRFGQRQLLLARSGTAICFASELSGLLAWPGLKRDLNTGVLGSILAFGHAPVAASPMAGVSRLLPGRLMTIRHDGSVSERCWWSLPKGPSGQPVSPPPPDLGARLAAGVRAAASTASGAVAFQGEDGALLAACLGQPARPAMTLPSPLPDLVRDLILRQGEPIVPEALVPALAACGAGDVLLAPTGGGELMLAHPRYRIFARAMSALREAEARGVSQRDGGFHEAPISARELWHGAAGGMDEAERLSILGPALMHTAVLAASRAYGTTLCDATSDCVMAEAARLDLEMRLPARDLVALDVAATYTGAAIICPFLDSEWAATLAGRPDRERRWLLPTQSSIAPDLSAWHPMGPALRGFTQDILQGSACRERDLFSRGQIDALLRRHAAKPGIEAGGLWALLGIELWCQVFLDAPAQLARPPRDEMDEQLLAITRRAA